MTKPKPSWAKRNASPWTEDEIAILRKMYAEGATYTAIGAVVGRSEDSVANERRKLGMPPKVSKIDAGWPVLRGTAEERHEAHCRRYLAEQLRELRKRRAA